VKVYSDLTDGMEYMLRLVSKGTATVWIGFDYQEARIERIREKWITDFGTNLSREKRRSKRERNLPTAVGVSVPVLGNPFLVQCRLLASKDALNATVGAFTTEKWLTRPIEVSDFVMSHEPRTGGPYIWTWRIQERQIGLLQKELIAHVKAGDAKRVEYITDHWVRLYPMFSGIRRQIRRLLNSARKLWLATMKSPWPGRDPDALPAMIGFRRSKPEGGNRPTTSRSSTRKDQAKQTCETVSDARRAAKNGDVASECMESTVLQPEGDGSEFLSAVPQVSHPSDLLVSAM
jgi:hypothetical protein